ncbi:MAG: leucine-rich repeat protein [Lachnospiraceae bacterium]|nr:leucine-rich repeat protein [Lachnospiraceae bacterium]
MRKKTRMGCLTLAAMLFISSISVSATEVTTTSLEEVEVTAENTTEASPEISVEEDVIAEIEVKEEILPETELVEATANVTVGDYTLTPSGDGYIVSKCNGNPTKVDFTSDEFAEYTILGIGENAFYNKGYLTEVVLPETVEMIGNYAFQYCNTLRKCNLPSNLTLLGKHAFENTALTEVTIPASCMVIGEKVFKNCNSLKTVIFEERTGTEELVLGDASFSACDKLQKIELPEQVTSVPVDFCYDATALTEVKISEKCESIGEGAFYGCSALAKVSVPENCASIGDSAFYKTKITDITIPAACTSIGENAFQACGSLKNVSFMESEIEDATLSIGKNAFSNCKSLATIKLPNTVKSVSENMFYQCTQLTSVQLSENCESIGQSAFYWCQALVTITIPKSCIVIGNSAFYGSALKEMICLNPDTSIAENAFSNNTLKEITITSEAGGAVEEFAQNNNCSYQRPATALTITNEPDKTTYLYGEDLLLDGMTLQAVFETEDGTDADVIDAADCTISGYDGKKVGKQEIKVVYGGAETSFEVIVAYDMSRARVSSTNLVYTGETLKNTFSVKGYETGSALVEGQDYYVEYVGDQISVGEKTARIIGRGNYVGEYKITYRIIPKSLYDIPNLEVKVSDVEYTGNVCTPAVTVSYGTTVIDPSNYNIEYSSNTNVGTATVYISAKNNYTGSTNAKFKILPKSLQNATVSFDKGLYAYNGTAIYPVTSVSVDGKVLSAYKDYEISYHNNIYAGTATATISGIGNYTGSISNTFLIDVVKGTKATVGVNTYRVISSDAVAFTGLSSKLIKKVTIPATVNIGGKTFKVKTIDNKALKGSKVTSVVIGKNVEQIGKEAFRKASKLKKITIKSTKLKSVGKNTFKGINSKATIKVPKKKLAAYKKLLKGKGQGKKVKIKK